MLAAYLKVPDSILNAAPSDGLFGDEKHDEAQLGATYDELEWAMIQDQEGKSVLTFSEEKKNI
jgi:NAD+ synthase